MKEGSVTLLIFGALMLGYAVTSLIFLKFWSKTGDRLFLYFSGAFALLVVERLLLVSVRPDNEHSAYIYLIRFVAFLIIIYGVVQKNRAGPR